ncbi:MAG TPA: DNA topoisomerase I [Candidatus Bathyarchaeia archaeon]|nr:DNA topoisomerase I [Candidatus Bathyarchaeia archaeon]
MHLIVTEKDLAAKRIAEILSDGAASATKVASANAYRFNSTVVLGLRGHIVKLDFPDEYRDWKINLHDLIRADVVTVPTHKSIVSGLKRAAKDAERVTIATDFDTEGELIGLEACAIVKSVTDVGVDRVRFSAMTPIEVKRAFRSPTRLDLNLAHSGEARQAVDLIWGAALTRFISTAAKRLGSRFLSAGRVQSPTLALIVDRERRIAQFVAEPYWEVYIDLSTNSEAFHAKHQADRFRNKASATAAVQNIGDTATVVTFAKSERVDAPPKPFNTTEFLAAASALGISASRAMETAERLYTAGWISYPRTDNTVYPNELDLRLSVSMFRSGPFAENARLLLQKKQLVATRGKKQTTDHPPIYPTMRATQADLEPQSWKVYELVVRRFFATLSDPARWCTKRVTLDSRGERFTATGLELSHQGWRYHYPYAQTQERHLPDLREGDVLTVTNKQLVDKETQPPQRWGQGQLIKKMEELGLGTKSTRHEIINKLAQRGYVDVNPLRPTGIACSVTQSLERYAPTITKPEMTRLLEEEMEKVKAGTLSKEFVVVSSRDILDKVLSTLDEQHEEISISLQEGLRGDATVGTCPQCSSDLVVRRSKRGGRFVGCSGYPQCTFGLPLPKSGRLRITARKCKQHDMRLIKVQSGKRFWDLGCPQCNYSNWKEKNKSA